MAATEPRLRWLNRHLDEVALLGVFARIAFADAGLSADDYPVLAAAERVAPGLFEQGRAGFAAHLREFEPEQIDGLASSVKGALHEMEFVEIENADGDSVYASMFDAPNHPDTDIRFTDETSGETWDAQLKATDDSAYVQDWIDRHPDGEIMVTDEIAQRMGLNSSGFDDQGLTLQTERFLDHIQELPDHDSIWNFAPLIAPLSAAIAVRGLWQRHRAGELSWEQFKRRAVWISGLKASKVALLTALLAIPGINAVTATVLLARMIVGGDRLLGPLPTLRSFAAWSRA